MAHTKGGWDVSIDDSSVEHLVEDYRARKVSRRAFFQRAAALGLSGSAAAGVLAAAARASAGGASAATAIKKGGQLIEGYDRDFSKIDPVLTTWDDPDFVAIYEYPVVRDAAGNYKPSLFESWHVSSDLLTWTFKLRPNLKFHSGAPVTAAAIAANFADFANPSVGQNAIFWPAVKGASAASANTLVVKMHHPFTAFPE